MISPEVSYEDMLDLVCRKLARDTVKLQFEDNEKSRVEILDEGDWAAASKSTWRWALCFNYTDGHFLWISRHGPRAC